MPYDITRQFPRTIMNLFEHSYARQTSLVTMNLGGTSGSTGGTGGPPGGFYGLLPQKYVTYDTTEAVTSGSVGGSGSTPSLVDNLDRIRFWMKPARWFEPGIASGNLNIGAGIWWTSGSSFLTYAGGNIATPASGKIYLDSSGSICNDATWPESGTYNPICEITGGAISKDVRKFFNEGGASGTGTPGGADTNIQVNVGGAFGGYTNLTFDGTRLLTQISDAAINTIVYPMRVSHITSDTAAVGFGAGIEFQLDDAVGNADIAGQIAFVWKDPAENKGISQLEIRGRHEPGGVTAFPLIGVISSTKTTGAAFVDGNARGIGAIEFQTYRTVVTQVASGQESGIFGGIQNTASGPVATIVGGASNVAIGTRATIAGGSENSVSSSDATIIGGIQNSIGTTADYSIAAGCRAKVANTHAGTFIFADSTAADFNSIVAGEFAIRARGGFRVAYDDSNYWQCSVGAAIGIVPWIIPADAVGYLHSSGSGVLTWDAGSGGTPGGNDTNIQVNNAGVFGGYDDFIYNGTEIGFGAAITAHRKFSLQNLVSTTTLDTLFGFDVEVRRTGPDLTDSSNAIYGISLSASNITRGSHTGDIVGGQFIAQQIAVYGNCSKIVGGKFRALCVDTGTVSTGIGGEFSIENNAGGLIDNAYGCKIVAPTFPAKINNYYGIYIEAATAATLAYSIYSAGGQSYFAGNIGIGITPRYLFDVAGTGTESKISVQRSSGSAASAASSAGVRVIRSRGETTASPAAILSGDHLGYHEYAAYYDASNITVGAYLSARATENWDSTHKGTKLVWGVTVTGGITGTEPLELDPVTGLLCLLPVISKPAGTAGIALNANAATGDFTLSLSPANLTGNRTITFPDATGTVPLLGTANVFTAVQAITIGSTAATTTPLAISATFTAASGTLIGFTSYAVATPTEASTQAVYGAITSATCTGEYNITSLVGYSGGAVNNSTATTVNQYGLYSYVRSTATSGTSTTTTVTGLRVEISKSGVGGTWVIGTAYGLRISAPTAVTGTLTGTTCYGIHLDDWSNPGGTWTTKWSIYSVGGNNAYGGNSRFGGVTAPVYTVDVTGNIKCTTGFGCNGANPQTAYASGGAVAPGAGAFGASSAANFAALATLVANIRLALIGNGVMS